MEFRVTTYEYSDQRYQDRFVSLDDAKEAFYAEIGYALQGDWGGGYPPCSEVRDGFVAVEVDEYTIQMEVV